MRTAFKKDAEDAWWIEQDLGDYTDYSFDWSSLLGDDALQTSAWSAEGPATPKTPSAEGQVTTVWVELDAGVAAGDTARIRNTVTTVGGRTFRRSFRLVAREL